MTSRRKHTWILIFCVVALAIFIIFRPSYGWRLQALLVSQNIESPGDQVAIAAENESLRAQLAAMQNVAAQMPQNPHNEIRAMVYSQYPFGFKNEILLDAGVNEGVVQGKAVTFQGIFIGSILKVFPDSAAVQTAFDPGFKIPVRIGAKGVDGLLLGGAFPRVTSIAKDAAIANGDIVYNAAAGFPYGLPVAIVHATSTSADKLFQEASLEFAYDANSMQTVLVAR